MEKYIYVDHTGDIEFHARGVNLEELFENCAYAVVNVICKKLVPQNKYKSVVIKAETLDNLLVEWLEELLFLHTTEEILFTKFEVKSIEKIGTTFNLKAEVEIGTYQRNDIETEIKAITYNKLKIEKNKYWQARVVIDI
jgi:SHS2 domain-containing protein